MAIDGTEATPEAEAGAADGAAAGGDDRAGRAPDQVGRDLRDSADAVRTLLDDAFLRLRRLDRDSPVTALVGQAVERFQQVHRDIDGLASNLDSAGAGDPDEGAPPQSD